MLKYITFCLKCDIIDKKYTNMNLVQHLFIWILSHRVPMLIITSIVMIPATALADWDFVDALNLAPFVSMVLDAMMMVATGGYEFFVKPTSGIGIIQMLIWGFFALSITLYLIKMYFPKTWVEFAGFSGGGEMISGEKPEKIASNILRPGIRAIIATVVLLQIKPTFVTDVLINPFLQFGAIYTNGVLSVINIPTPSSTVCPPEIISNGWISQASCNYLLQPVSDLSHANNQIVKNGLDFVINGLTGLFTPIFHGGTDFMNILTGILLIIAFVGCNIFMALLIIGAIFEMGMALILYPFQVLTWVVTAKNSDGWFDVWPAFSGIVKALQQLIITMIACAIILGINIAIANSMLGWLNTLFADASGNNFSFGSHTIIWITAILTIYIMYELFNKTRQILLKFAGSNADAMYKTATADTKNFANTIKNNAVTIGKALGWIKK
ncbi:MAG: hypothetical protein MJ187_01110 [Alphaproteobacteria bacterium]|nr:hypothetical protein [Alphaproteobacteria bacterium]